MSKQPKRQTCEQKKEQFKTPANYYASKRHKAAVQLNNEINEATVQLNNEINEAAESIQKNTKDLAPEFSKTVNELFWDLV